MVRVLAQSWTLLDLLLSRLEMKPAPDWHFSQHIKIRTVAPARLQSWAKLKRKITVTRALFILMISAIDFSVSLLMNWLKMSYYALFQLPVKQKVHRTQSLYGRELCFDQWGIQLRFFFSIRRLCRKQLLTVEGNIIVWRIREGKHLETHSPLSDDDRNKMTRVKNTTSHRQFQSRKK